mgnify:FL=1
MRVLENLEPRSVFYWFEEICSIPHGSMKEEKLAARIVDFAKERGLFCEEDASHNVLVRKPASAGLENAPPLILQAHIDMIWAKEKGVAHDFETQGLKLYVDGDKVRARGTTLGADDGIGAAFMLAVLDDADLVHPPIEAVFTTAEEIGMVGAKHFDMSKLTGKRMINFDAGGFTEGRIYVGCAGNLHARLRQALTYVPAGGGTPRQITLLGLQGGHSGGDIDKGRGNSSQILGRLLALLLEDEGVEIADLSSGDVTQENKNGIPTEFTLTVNTRDVPALEEKVRRFSDTLRDELSDVDDHFTFNVQPAPAPAQVLSRESALTAARILTLLPNGVRSMQRVFTDTPECSANIGNVEIHQGAAEYYLSVRSCKSSLIDAICQQYRALAELTGSELTLGQRLPTWDYDKNSQLRRVVEAEYVKEFGAQPRFKVTHASTECSLFKENDPQMDIISMGPIIYEEHTPGEYLGIESVGVLWNFLRNILKQL